MKKPIGRGLGALSHFANQFNLDDAGLPKPVKDLLNKVNDDTVNSITIGRTPVQSAIQGILKTVSTVPYDNLFHLFMIFNTAQGRKIVFEKNARINMSLTLPTIGESILLTNVPHYTIKDYVSKTKQFMGDKFIPYHPSTNNCQDFICGVLKGNGISEGIEFVKQDTTMIFKNKGWLSDTAHAVTNLGGYADVLLKGGLLHHMRAGNLSNELSDKDIMDLVRQLKIPHFKGCFLKSQIPKLNKGDSCIINLNGHSHWCALIRLDTYYYLDSFGIIAPKELDRIDYVYSEVDLQSMNSSACGWFALAFVISMNRKGDPMKMYQEFIQAFKSPDRNDAILKKKFHL
jgi:hypothetical protein